MFTSFVAGMALSWMTLQALCQEQNQLQPANMSYNSFLFITSLAVAHYLHKLLERLYARIRRRQRQVGARRAEQK